MMKQARQNQDKKNPVLTNKHSSQNGADTLPLQFEDRRPEALAQRQLQTIANGSRGVTQLKGLQGMANDSFTPDFSIKASSANIPGSVVQRYKVVKNDSYTLDKDKGPDARKPFTRFEDELSVVKNKQKEPVGHKWKSKKDKLPPLYVANDDSLAINSKKGEPKEFYAENGVMTNSNKALGDVKSPVELFGAGNSITVGGKKLVMVQPKIIGKEAPGKDKFAGLATDVCRDVAKEIIGGKINHALLQGQNGQERVEINTVGSTEVTKTHDLAGYMTNAGDKANFDDASKAMDNKANPRAGKEFGTASRGTGKATEAAKKLGVNEYAWSKVGQAYVTQSIFDKQESKKNYADAAEPTNAFVWGYHFSSVVAESLDGNDQVAMENYARRTDIAAGKTELLAELKKKFAAKIISLKLEGSEEKQIGMTLKFVQENLTVTQEEAGKAYSNMFKELNGNVGEHWYFRMIGKGKGQSFHEQMAESSYFVNPLTLSVANLALKSYSLTFDKGSTDLNVAISNTLKGIASDILSSIAQGQKINSIKLTGFGSGWKNTGIGAKVSGKTRAEKIKAKLVELGVPDNLVTVVESPGKKVSKSGPANRSVEMEIS